MAADATFTFARKDFAGLLRTAEEVHAMSLANLEGEYATVLTAAQLRKDLSQAAASQQQRSQT